MLIPRKPEVVSNDAHDTKTDRPEQLRVFANGTFVFAAFEHGYEMVVDLNAKEPRQLEALLRRLLPYPV